MVKLLTPQEVKQIELERKAKEREVQKLQRKMIADFKKLWFKPKEDLEVEDLNVSFWIRLNVVLNSEIQWCILFLDLIYNDISKSFVTTSEISISCTHMKDNNSFSSNEIPFLGFYV